jgi:Protein of unknown function (DUF1552)
MTKGLNRRELMKLGITGLMTSQLIGLRAEAQSSGIPPRRVILFHVPEGIHWHYWTPTIMLGQSGERRLSDVVGKVVAGDDSNLWKVFQEEFRDASGKNPISNLLDEVNLIDGISNAAGGGDEDGIDSHHKGIMGFRAGVYAKDEKVEVPFGGYNQTIDQLIAQAWFANGKPPSVLDNVLEVKLMQDGYDYRGSRGLPELYKSVNGNGSPAGVLESGKLWDTLFNGFSGSSTNTPSSASTALRERLERMKRRNAFTLEEVNRAKSLLGKDEFSTLESYLTAVGRAEQRVADQVAIQNSGTDKTCRIPQRTSQIFARNQFRDLSKSISEQIALAMACDRIRLVHVSPFSTNPGNVNILPKTQGGAQDWHTACGHTAPFEGDRNGFYVYRYNLEMEMMRSFLELVAALKRVPEGKGSILDSTSILIISEHCGEHHRCHIPHFALMAGGGGIKPDGNRYYKTGRYIRLPYTMSNTTIKPYERINFTGLRAANDLCLTLAHGAGVTRAKDNFGNMRDVDRFGHPSFTKGPLSGIA